MPLPSPPRIPGNLGSIPDLAAAMRALVDYQSSLYTSSRLEIRTVEKYAELEKIPVTTLITVAKLTQAISNPPTQAEVLAIQNKLNEVIDELSKLQANYTFVRANMNSMIDLAINPLTPQS